MIFSVLHSFVNLFAGGRSASKTILFVLFVLTLFGTLLFPLRKTTFHFSWKWFFIPLAGIFLLGGILHGWYVHSLGLPYNAFVITFSNDALSSSTLSHIHLAKSFVGELLYLLSLPVINTDAGLAYLMIVPSWVRVVGGMLLLWVLFQSIYQFVVSVRPSFEGYTRRQIITHTIGYAIAIFSLVKSSIDGGLFVPSVALAVAVVVLYRMRLRSGHVTRWYPSILALILVVFGLGLLLNMQGGGTGNLYIGIAALVSVYLLLFVLGERSVDRRMCVAAAVLFVAAWWVVSGSDRDAVSYANTKLLSGDIYYRYDKIKKGVVLERSMSDTTLASVAHGVNLSYHPIQVPWKTCLPEAVPMIVTGTLITDQVVAATSIEESGYRIELQESVHHGSVWHTPIEIVLDPCLPQAINVVGDAIRALGLKYFVLRMDMV